MCKSGTAWCPFMGCGIQRVGQDQGQAVHDERRGRAEDTQPNKSRDKLGPLTVYGRYLISD